MKPLRLALAVALTMTKPDPAVSGYVEIDWLRVYVPT